MKKIKMMGIFFTVAAFAVFFYSCAQNDDDETMTISGRLDKFVADVNNSPGSVYTNCHPDAAKYNQAKPAEYWTTNFGTGFALSDRSTSGTTVTATGSGGNFNGFPIAFTMQEDGTDNWKIKTISVASFSFN